MRKLPFLFFALLLATAVVAQDAGKVIKGGQKALNKYNADNSDQALLMEARKAAEQATSLDASLSGGWQLLGDTYAAEVAAVADRVNNAQAEFQKAQLLDADNAVAPSFPDLEVPSEAAKKALEAYQKAYAAAEKSRYKADAVTGMRTVSNNMGVLGNEMLSAGRYADAYGPMQTMNGVDGFLRENGEDPIYADDAQINQQKYITAVVAQQAGDNENAKRLFKELYDAGHDEPAVYGSYSQILMADGDTEGGLAVLTKGREKYPDNSEILFAEINYYIQKQDFATLESKLQQAIAAEPDNVGLYNALGNVYMNLGQGAEDPTAAQGYYDKSMKYFTEATDRDAENVDAIYSMGSMKFNEAVKLNARMQDLGNSKAEQAQYDEMNARLTQLFDEALPYFERAEKIDPNDRNTLIALKEIYARKGDYDKSNQYKERLGPDGR